MLGWGPLSPEATPLWTGTATQASGSPVTLRPQPRQRLRRRPRVTCWPSRALFPLQRLGVGAVGLGLLGGRRLVTGRRRSWGGLWQGGPSTTLTPLRLHPQSSCGRGREPRWGGTGEREAPAAGSWGRPVASFLPVAGSLLERNPRPRTPMVSRPSSRPPPGCFPKPSPIWALRSRPDPSIQCPGPPTPPEAPGGPTPLPWHPGPADTKPNSEVSGLRLRPDGPPRTPGPAGDPQDSLSQADEELLSSRHRRLPPL